MGFKWREDHDKCYFKAFDSCTHEINKGTRCSPFNCPQEDKSYQKKIVDKVKDIKGKR